MRKYLRGVSVRQVAFAVFLLLCPSSLSLHGQEPFCAQVANYFIDVRLDIERQTITGKEWVTWTNSTDSPALELWFHLYWNAFQNNRSTFHKEDGRGGPDLYRFGREDWGHCRVGSIQIIESADFDPFDLTSRIRFRQPDDGNSFDQTVISVRLPQPVAPDHTIDLVIAFEAKIPKPVSRTGVHNRYYFIAQWYPKLGVFQDGEWNCHQYHRASEYYADYGTYDVQITLPSSFVVGATGEHREQEDNGDGTTTHRFFQHSVHDFAWVASPRLQRFTEEYTYASDRTTEITLLLQPYHRKLKDRYLNAVKNAVRYASLWLGDYPYSTITCVDPAYNSRSGGMEYPTFFTGGAYFLSRPGIPRPEAVTIHEFGHGYFYGLLGSNEFEQAWMDEGMTSYLDAAVYREAYGDPVFWRNFFGIPVTFPQVRIPIESEGISSHRMTWNRDEMQRNAWQYMDTESYGANAYAKAALLMLTLRRYLGEEVFDPMLKAYSTRWWWRHPRPSDFFAVVSEFAGQDMSWFLDQFIYGSGHLDYAVGRITNRPVPPQKGWFGLEYRTGQEDRPGEQVYESEVLVRRLGEIKVPVKVLIRFSDDRTMLLDWDGQYRWKKYTFRSSGHVTQAVVDPDFVYVSDINRTNNSRMLKPARLAPWRWAAVWLHWLQHTLELFAFIGS